MGDVTYYTNYATFKGVPILHYVYRTFSLIDYNRVSIILVFFNENVSAFCNYYLYNELIIFFE